MKALFLLILASLSVQWVILFALGLEGLTWLAVLSAVGFVLDVILAALVALYAPR